MSRPADGRPELRHGARPGEFWFIAKPRTWQWHANTRGGCVFRTKGDGDQVKGPRFPAENTALPFVQSGCSPAEPDWYCSLFMVSFPSSVRSELHAEPNPRRVNRPKHFPLCSENAPPAPGTLHCDGPNCYRRGTARFGYPKTAANRYKQVAQIRSKTLSPNTLRRRRETPSFSA